MLDGACIILIISLLIKLNSILFHIQVEFYSSLAPLLLLLLQSSALLLSIDFLHVPGITTALPLSGVVLLPPLSEDGVGRDVAVAAAFQAVTVEMLG